MNTETSKITGISNTLLHRYVEMRHRIDGEADTIYSITSILAHYENCADHCYNIDPVALGKLNQIMNKNILKIWEMMDDFIYIVQAELELKRLESDPE